MGALFPPACKASLKSRKELIRPLLEWTKKGIREYAEENDLVWSEDPTNTDEAYLRNYIRRNILSRFTKEGREALARYIKQTTKINDEIDKLPTDRAGFGSRVTVRNADTGDSVVFTIVAGDYIDTGRLYWIPGTKIVGAYTTQHGNVFPDVTVDFSQSNPEVIVGR